MRLLSKNLKKKLENELAPIIQYIIADRELDLQIRDNYINVYYKGGNILLIKPQSFYFDEYYFYTECDKKRKSNLVKDAKKGNAEDRQVICKLRDERDKLLSLLSQQRVEEYFSQAKKIMDSWEKSLQNIVTHEEKKEQQQIATANRDNTEFVVLDLEYAVSRNSEFAYNCDSDKQVPRFDIVAIHNGQLYVIELKKGLGATGGVSGIKPHIKCYANTIGRDHNGLFVKEMKELLEQKKGLHIIDENLSITNPQPKFIFAFADESNMDEFNEFVQLCRNAQYDDEIIYLDTSHKLVIRK